MSTGSLYPPTVAKNVILSPVRATTTSVIDRLDALLFEYQKAEAAPDPDRPAEAVIPEPQRITLALFFDTALRLSDALRVKPAALNMSALRLRDAGFSLCQLLVLFRLFDLPLFSVLVCKGAPLGAAHYHELEQHFRAPTQPSEFALYEKRLDLLLLAYPSFMTKDPAPAPGGEETMCLEMERLPFHAFAICRFLFSGIEPSEAEIGANVFFVGSMLLGDEQQ